MQPLHIALLQSDLRTERSLVDFLLDSFHSIHAVHSVGELQTVISKYPVRIAVLDLEFASLADVTALTKSIPGLSVVCNHRVADEELWMAALNAGATDCYPSYDVAGISKAAVHSGAAAAHAA